VSGCPPRVKLLTLVAQGEDVPHLQECEDCREFVAGAAAAVGAFDDLSEVEETTRRLVDSLLAEMPPHRWTASFLKEHNLCHSVVVRDLLRRADDLYGSDPRHALNLTSAALSICDAMGANGSAPSAELRFEVLKSHAWLLRRYGMHDDALTALARAACVADETNASELYRGIVSVSIAIVYSEPDVARFDEAIHLAEAAGAVFDVCGDQRRAAVARHTKAYALVVMNRFEAAVPLLTDVLAAIGDTDLPNRDAALAHALLAFCLLNIQCFGEALDHARIAEHIHTECGDTVDAARAAHVAAGALAAMGYIDDAREEFARTAEVVFQAGLFDVWCLLRLDYIAAALEADAAADIRSEVEAVARVSMTMGTSGSTRRRQFAAQAMDYLRRLAIRDAVTVDVVSHVRAFIRRNAAQQPTRFSPPPGSGFVM
jgi:tetratricopeptide (TPR) repeat protein